MHLGLTPWNLSDLCAQSLTEQARFAESLGYQSFWLPENHFGHQFGPMALPDPLMLLASVAAGTETIKLGATSFLLTIRHPLLAAEQVAVLDQLSKGRVILGVGRGFAAEMFNAFNVDPRDKRRLFETRLEFMRRAWSGEPVAIDDASPVRIDPLPLQQPYPPIWLAAFGPKALAQAGRLGLPYLASPIETIDTLRQNFALHAEAAAAAGHSPVLTRPIMRTVYIDDRAADIASLRERLSGSSSPFRHAEAAVEDWAIVGERSYVADKLAQCQEDLQVTHLVVGRLRLAGVEQCRLRESVAGIAELVGQMNR